MAARGSRTPVLVALALSVGWTAVPTAPARAAEQASPSPALAACDGLATTQLQRTSAERFASLQLLDEDLAAGNRADKVGSQPVATVLSGYGVRRDKGGEAVDVRFLCLLDGAGKPLFVDLLADGPRDPVDACWDDFQPAGWGELTDCLEKALQRAEGALAAALAKAGEEAKGSLDPLSAQRTLQESSALWAKYRDGECDRRQAAVLGRNHPDVGELTCRIRETAERLADLQFDE